METSILTTGGIEMLLRWAHYLAGVTWIGVLYYFNFIQGTWFKQIEGNVKSVAMDSLVPRALWWFRWGAMFTFLSGFCILMMKSQVIAASPAYAILILTGASMGTFMFLNVWLIIWPAQKVVIGSSRQVANGGEAIASAADCAAKAALASRTNTLFSIPMLFFMGSAMHLPLSVSADFNKAALVGALTVIIGGLELNAIFGKQGPMTSVKGVITCGFILTAVLYCVIECLT